MATTYTTSKTAAGVQEREFSGGVTSVSGSYDIASGSAFIINDVVQMVKIPSGARILYAKVTVPSLDSSTGVVWALGDGGDDDRFITGATTGRSGAGGVSVINTVNSEYTYTADDTIDFKITTAATGTAATTGIVYVDVVYTLSAQPVANYAAVASGTGDVQVLTGRGRLRGLSARESAGTAAAASFVLRDGTSTAGPAMVFVQLAADECTNGTFGDGIEYSNGVYVDREAGTTEITVFY